MKIRFLVLICSLLGCECLSAQCVNIGNKRILFLIMILLKDWTVQNSRCILLLIEESLFILINLGKDRVVLMLQ